MKNERTASGSGVHGPPYFELILFRKYVIAYDGRKFCHFGWPDYQKNKHTAAKIITEIICWAFRFNTEDIYMVIITQEIPFAILA